MKNGLFGDGIHDDTAALQKMLDNSGEVHITAGDYRTTSTLIIKSNTSVIADQNARIFMCGDTPRKRGDFLLSTCPNKHNVNISITGGVWDGNNLSPLIKKAEIFDNDGYSGAALNFVSVENLSLTNMTVLNPAAYYFRFNRIKNFVIKDILFKSKELRSNQDGLHFCGEIYDGIIENIFAETVGQTNDDLIAFNADDCIDRTENLDMVNGNIERIKVKNIHAEDCHTFLRLLSVNSKICDVDIDNVSGGMREYAINMDAARDCRTPIFDESERPHGVGCIENVTISNMKVHWTHETNASSMILCESLMDNFRIKNFTVDMNIIIENRQKPILLVKNIYKRVMKTPLGKNIVLNNKSDKFEYHGDIDEVLFTKN